VIWRTDWAFGYAFNESPWLTKLPSEYFRDHFRLTTFGLEQPRQPEKLVQLLKSMRWFGNTLVYASGYPSIWGCEPLDKVLARLPEEWHEGIAERTASDFYRWPDRPKREAPAPTLSRSALSGPKVTGHDLTSVARPGD
jgi:hypothetical protein